MLPDNTRKGSILVQNTKDDDFADGFPRDGFEIEKDPDNNLTLAFIIFISGFMIVLTAICSSSEFLLTFSWNYVC